MKLAKCNIPLPPVQEKVLYPVTNNNAAVNPYWYFLCGQFCMDYPIKCIK